jgi:hypothetical protein
MTWFCQVEDNCAILKNTTFFILGDLNLNSASHNINNYMNYFLTYCTLIEYNDIVNDKGSKLDVVLVSECADAVRVCTACEGLVDRADVYHPPLDISITVSRPGRAVALDPSNIKSATDWNFGKANFSLLYELISKIDWTPVLAERCVNRAVEQLYCLLYGCFDEAVPKKRRSGNASRRYPAWFSADIIGDLKLKGALHKNWKVYGDPEVYHSYSELRASIKCRVTAAYDAYILTIQQNINTDPKAFWKHISNLRSKGGFEPTVSYGGQTYSGQAAAGAFADYFSSVFLPWAPLLSADQAGLAASDRLLTSQVSRSKKRASGLIN